MTDYTNEVTNLDLETDEDEKAWQNLMDEIYANESMVDKSTYTRQELDEIAETMIANVGVNKELATALEALVPGAVTNSRLIASFSHEFTQTNYKITLEDIDKVKTGLMVAGSIGIVAIIVKIVLWLRDKFRKIFGKNTSDVKSQVEASKDLAEKQAANYKAMQHELEGKLKSSNAKEILKTYNDAITALGGKGGLSTSSGASDILEAYDDAKYTDKVVKKFSRHLEECSRGLPDHLRLCVTILEDHTHSLVEGIKKFKEDMLEEKPIETDGYRVDWKTSKSALDAFDKKFHGSLADGANTTYSTAFKEMFNRLKGDCKPGTGSKCPPKKAIVGMTFGLNDFPDDANKLMAAFDHVPAELSAISDKIKGIPEHYQKNRRTVLAILADDWHVVVFAAQSLAFSYQAHVRHFDAVTSAVKDASGPTVHNTSTL